MSCRPRSRGVRSSSVSIRISTIASVITSRHGIVRTEHLLVSFATTCLVIAAVYRAPAGDVELPNRVPEPAPYVAAEAEVVPPPFEDFWSQLDHPGQCQTCHARVFNEWNGSMMANAWRDQVWRAACLLSVGETSTAGNSEV